MKLPIIVSLLGLAACAPTRPLQPLDATSRAVALVEFSLAVQIAAEICSVDANQLARFDVKRADALTDACVVALIPPHDAVAFAQDTPASVGCAAKSVRVGLERTRAVLVSAGYGASRWPSVVFAGLALAERLEAHALASCDPLHPSTTSTTFVDPNIANVEPEYPR